MFDSIVSLEEIAERMLTIFRIRWEIEKTKNAASLKAPLMGDEHFMYGDRTIIAQSDAVCCFPEMQDTIDELGSDMRTANYPCCAEQASIIHIKFYHKEHEIARGSRVINQMGEVLKRVLLRNKRLVLFLSPLIIGLKIERIMYDEIAAAYEGEDVFYPRGQMYVRVKYNEGLEEELS